MTLSRRILRALGALVVLVALLAGVPAALWHYVGWPLPHAIPTWAELRGGLTGRGIPDDVLIKALAVVAWLAWASLAASVWTEAWAAARGRIARRLPGLYPVQALAGQLVAAVVLVVSPLNRPSPPHHRPALALVLHSAEAGTVAPSGPLAVTLASATTPVVAPTNSYPSYTVARRDTLWGIAAGHLGDPLRWPEIYRLNRGRPQPDGAALTDPNVIRPGWSLLLPVASASDGSAPQGAPVTTATPPEPPSAPSPPSPAAAPSATPGGAAAGPAVPADAPPASGPVPAPALQIPDHRPPAQHAVRLPSGSVIGLGLAAAVAAALGAAALRRRTAYRPSPPRGGPITGAAPVPDTPWRLRSALAALAGEDAGPGEGATSPNTLGIGRFCTGRASGGEVVVDLLDGSLDLDGPGAASVLRALLVEVVAANRADQAGVVVAGAELAATLFDTKRAEAMVEVVAELSGALGRLEIELIRRARLLAEAETDDYRSYATARPEDPLPLLVVVHGPTEASVEGRLAAVEAVAARLGIGLIGVRAPIRRRHVVIDDAGSVIGASGVGEWEGASLYHLTRQEARECLAAVAGARGEPEPNEPTPPDAAAPGWPATGAATVEALVLGPEAVRVGGEEVRAGLRSKARELLALLACHPDGLTWEAAAEALWPDIDAQRGNDRFRTVVANLRSLGGHLGDGAAIVERVGQCYRLDTGLVTCDLWRFQRALETAASAADDQRAYASLDTAVSEYREELCEGGDYAWVEPARDDLRRRALDALVRLAELDEGAGELEGATARLERAIEVDPYAEAVYGRLIALYGRRGQPDAARAVHARLVAHLDEIGADPQAETDALLGQATAAMAKLRLLSDQ
jgi:DNA-binding SARP family transcriptional activator